MSTTPPHSTCHVCGSTLTLRISIKLQLTGCTSCYISNPLGTIQSEPISPNWIDKLGEATTQAIAKLVSCHFIANPSRWLPRLSSEFPDWKYDSSKSLFPRDVIVIVANDLAKDGLLARKAVRRLQDDCHSFFMSSTGIGRNFDGLYINRIVSVDNNTLIGVGFYKHENELWYLTMIVMRLYGDGREFVSISEFSMHYKSSHPSISDPSEALFNDLKFNYETLTLTFVYKDHSPGNNDKILYIVRSVDGNRLKHWSINVIVHDAVDYTFPLKRGWIVVGDGTLGFLDETLTPPWMKGGTDQRAHGVVQALSHFTPPWANLDEAEVKIHEDEDAKLDQIPLLVPNHLNIGEPLCLRDYNPSTTTNLSVIMHQKRIFIDAVKRNQLCSIPVDTDDTVLLPDDIPFAFFPRDIAQLGQDVLAVTDGEGRMCLMSTKRSVKAAQTLLSAILSVVPSKLCNVVGRRMLWEPALLEMMFRSSGFLVRSKRRKRSRD